MTREVGPARGILRTGVASGKFHHARIAPCEALREVVQHFWSVRWDLRGHPAQTRETLPHPNVHLVFDALGARVYGIQAGRFSTILEGQAGVFGVKFRPGGFRSLLGRPLSTIRNRTLTAAEIMAPHAQVLAKIDPMDDDDLGKATAVECMLLGMGAAVGSQGRQAACIVDDIADNQDLLTVEQLTSRWAMTIRSLQRLFNEQVGVSPKWVINRYRIHEVIERLSKGIPTDWTRLALDLGYFDQAHFIRDFKRLVGCAPGEYARGSEGSARSESALRS
ncbi:AraC family transcriptional regulator [Dokdonella sp.]|uniref:AraC family transcriptional regulator n=1 Tax=Dokdonella sp. TaxID=2291710 RepID=UPI003C3562CE